jgi:chaperonin cofactor prefoldin
MTHPTQTKWQATQRVGLSMLAVLLLVEVGCVSRSTYERTKAEKEEHTHALEIVQEDVKELDQHIAALQATNRREEATTTELQAAIQRQEEQLPLIRQQADERFSTLKVQVATLMNQSWHLARKIVDIRQESASFQTIVAQYKQDQERSHDSLLPAPGSNKATPTQPTITEPAPTTVPLGQTSAPPQMTQGNPVSPNLAPSKPTVPSPSVSVEPPSASDSWIGTISRWLSTLWNWLFG